MESSGGHFYQGGSGGRGGEGAIHVDIKFVGGGVEGKREREWAIDFIKRKG